MHALVPLLVLSVLPADSPPAWTTAHRKGALTADETRAFMKELARHVEANHLKKAPGSPQRGMVYEYFDPARKGRPDQWVQGEALDTMHDGAWLAAALATAYRATGDRYYRELLTGWVLPFYCKMLNHSDTLFSARKNDARPKAHVFDREHALQEGEKGFVPYWWDDGASVSLERRRDRNPRGPFPCTDLLAGKPNPHFRLSGWSHGSSNHLAQDLGVMLLTAWLLLRDSDDRGERKLAKEVAEAARNLHECRMRHHGHIPMCVAPAALALGDAKLLRHVPDLSVPAVWQPNNHTWRALYDFRPGQRCAFPGFADDQQYRYYFGLARHGGKLPEALAFKVIYDAFTEPRLYHLYCDDELPPPGINRFDLHPYYCKDGRPEDYRSDRKGPHRRPRPIGSRMGPQNMICCGWALQLLAERPGLWEERYRRQFSRDLRVHLAAEPDAKGRQSAPVTLGEATLRLQADTAALRLEGTCRAERLVLEVFARPDARGTSCKLTIPATGSPTAVNETGAALAAAVKRSPSKGGFTFTVRLPWTAAREQKAGWANGVEHGRYSLRIGKEVRNFYLASAEESVKAWLKRELGEGLATWRAIFKEKGYIPTGVGAGDWDRFSDSGGHAHLIAAGAQWLYVLAGKNDWQTHRVPALLPAK